MQLASQLMHHWHLYAFPPAARPGPGLNLSGRTLKTIACRESEIANTVFAVSFEQAVERLQKLDRLFIELDGSFVWSGHDQDQAWQIDGMLYDTGQHLQRVELKGWSPPLAWRQLLICFEWPDQRLLVHWIDLECFVDIDELFSTLDGIASA